MKKTYLLLGLVAALAGCQRAENPHLRKTDLKIISPTGAPAISMYNFTNGLTTITNPQLELMPQFKKGEFDIIVAPAKGGLTQITKNAAEYKMAAVVTFGNFALVKVNPNDEELSAGDNVVYFQKEDIPGSVFSYLYGDLGLNLYDVADASKTGPVLNTGTIKIDEETINVDYVFSAEPVISNLKKSDLVVERASDAFTRKTGGKRIIQAAVFVKNDLEEVKVNDFLTLLQDDITKGVANYKNIVKTMNIYGVSEEQKALYGFDSTTISACMSSYNGLGLGYVRAKENKEEIEYFVNDILNSGLTITDEAYF